MSYFDFGATTPVSKEVYEAMTPFLSEKFGNPNAKYYDLAVEAKEAITNARSIVAKYFDVTPEECIFTSGATESNNFIIKGVAGRYQKPAHMITSSIEHSSILESMKYLETQGWKITYLGVNHEGKVSPDDLANSITQETKLISIGYVNSEIGTIQDLEKLSGIASEKNVLFHTDATQALGKIRISSSTLRQVTFISLSSHKIYGPKGSGAAIIKRDLDGVPFKIVPLIHGGEQEFGYRGGTLNVPGIIGMAKALEMISDHNYLQAALKRVSELEKQFVITIKDIFGDNIEFINSFKDRAKGIISIRFKGINNQIFLKKTAHVFSASTGSACSNTKPSHVLASIGLSPNEVREIVRFTIGHTTTVDQINKISILFNK